ncbi:glycosyltransferase family 9 protein [Lonsdalea quercina]|uniref:glycosyltransferase family 9 protein n=1 Tax=Lonsdalea quercina TaxID=71657 RepID=UPI003974A926
MKKGWKFKLVDLFLHLYTRGKGRLQPPQQLVTESAFSHIVIYSTTALGDLMFNTPAIHAVRQRFPQAKITLVVHKKLEAFVEGGEDWQHVVCWNTKIKTVPQLVRDIQQFGIPDLAIILHSHDPYDYLSAVMSGAKYVLRDNYVDGITPMDRWLAGYVIGFRGHVIQRKLALVSMLGADVSDISMRIPFAVPPVDKAGRGTVIGFQMGASTSERCWPVESFAAVAEHFLATDPNCQIALTGWSGDRPLAESLLRQVDPALHSRIVNHIGSSSLKELVGLINGMDVLVTGDTGPLHIAIALKVPTVSLFVTAEPHSTGPYQDPDLHDVIYGATNNLAIQQGHVMEAIEPHLVIDRVAHRIERIKAKADGITH